MNVQNNCLKNYSILNSYIYNDKNIYMSCIDKLSSPCRLVLGGRTVNVISQNSNKAITTATKIKVLFISIIITPIAIISISCLVIKILSFPWFWEKKKISLQFQSPYTQKIETEAETSTQTSQIKPTLKGEDSSLPRGVRPIEELNSSPFQNNSLFSTPSVSIENFPETVLIPTPSDNATGELASKQKELTEIFASSSRKFQAFNAFLEDNTDFINEDSIPFNPALFPTFLENIEPRLNTEDMGIICDVFKTNFKKFQKCFYKSTQILNFQGIKLIVEKLIKRGKINDCVVCDDLRSFKELILKIMQGDTKPNTQYSFIVRCFVGNGNPISSNAHVTPILLEKTTEGWRVLMSDASNDPSPMLLVNFFHDKKIKIFMGGNGRQKDGISCALFAIHDLMQIKKYNEQGSNIFDYIDTQEKLQKEVLSKEEQENTGDTVDNPYLIFKMTSLPPGMMNMTQNIDVYDAYMQSKEEHPSISEKRKKYSVTLPNGKVWNVLSQKRFLRYQAILLRELYSSSLPPQA